MVHPVLADLKDVIDPVIEGVVARAEILPDHPDSLAQPVPEEQQREQLKQALREQVYDRKLADLTLRAAAVLEKHLGSTADPERCARELAGISEAANALSTTMLEAVFGKDAQPEEIKAQLREALLNSDPDAEPDPADAGEFDGELLEDYTPIHEALGVSRETFNDLYALGRRLFEQRHLDDAEALFHFLTNLDGACHEAWFSVGACRQLRGEPQDAIAAYMTALQLNAGNPSLYRNLADCFLALSDRASAEDVIELGNACLPEFELTQEQQSAWEAALADLRSRL